MRNLKIYILSLLVFTLYAKVILPVNVPDKVAVIMQNEDSFTGTKNERLILEQITAWELMLMDSKIGYDVITPDDIDVSLSENYSALIIATNIVIDKDQWFSLKEYSENSGRIIFSGTISVNEDEYIISYNEVVNQLTGLTISQFSSKELKSVKQIFTGVNQHTSGISYKSSLLLTLSENIYCTDITGSSGETIGYLDWSSATVPAQTSLLYGIRGNMKYIWCGFNINNIIGGNSDKELFNQFIKNSSGWLSGRTYTQIGNSQLDKFSFIVSPIINGRIDQTEKLKALIDEFQLHPFFLISETAVYDSALLIELKSLGEFGLKINDPDKSISNLGELVQSLKKITKKQIEYVSINDINSVIKYRQEILSEGIKIIFLSGYNESSIPFFIDDDKELLIIPETYLYKNNPDNLRSLPLLVEAVYEQYNETLINLSLDLDLCSVEDDKRIKNFLSGTFRKSLKTNFYTNIDLNRIYEWYRLREGIKLTATLNVNGRSEIELVNKNDVQVDNLFFIITSGKMTKEPFLYEENRISDLHFEFKKNKNELKIYVKELMPYQTKRIRIELNESL